MPSSCIGGSDVPRGRSLCSVGDRATPRVSRISLAGCDGGSVSLLSGPRSCQIFLTQSSLHGGKLPALRLPESAPCSLPDGLWWAGRGVGSLSHEIGPGPNRAGRSTDLEWEQGHVEFCLARQLSTGWRPLKARARGSSYSRLVSWHKWPHCRRPWHPEPNPPEPCVARDVIRSRTRT